MSKPDEYQHYLEKAVALMSARMAAPKNLSRPSLSTKTFPEQNRALERAVTQLRRLIQEDRIDEAWVQAADVANLAWILVVTLENQMQKEAASE